MIPRYSPKDIAAIWTEEAKFQRWLQLEIAAVEARMEAGVVPEEALGTIKEKAKFDVAEILEIEKETKHDVIAFLTNVAGYVGPDSRYIHEGLTSSDVVDTCLAMQMRDAGHILLGDIEQLITVLGKRAVEFKYTLEMGRTHGIHAEPTTFGLKLLLWHQEMLRHLDRMKRAVAVISVGKISGAVGTYQHLSPEIEAVVCENSAFSPLRYRHRSCNATVMRNLPLPLRSLPPRLKSSPLNFGTCSAPKSAKLKSISAKDKKAARPCRTNAIQSPSKD